MIISEEILFKNGAILQDFAAEDVIFRENTASQYYYQIKTGVVKLNNLFEDGKEFVHGFPYEGHCFGEAYLLTENHYAVNAIAVTDCTVFKLDKESYLNLIHHQPQIFFKVSRYSAERLHFRYLISSFLAILDPQIKIQKLLDHLKSYFGYQEKYSFLVPFTRYQLASLTGMRVETMIRTVKKMEKLKILKIDNTKIYY
ncbi:CRP-like cAMP-binding protein [Chryseobacterium sp. SORGH_AS 447]|uniref:Crp/Fnr family transcriptional regulator n=1 Tax=Chryseobacterium sp. SORGH_AS_0447 TaxID=3041769 RepID=UPI002784CEFB|nr:Crp/Fnr family transcriptional regulator [Chryseobacterium sp. SORGH_AS_0447]MDQ1161489.1 CRP-like cAMP-binding protein [Chryseobacterium sp. SORGH_AS_0447]